MRFSNRTVFILMKEKIIALRSENKTYREIQEILGCSRSLVSYYVNPNGKSNMIERQNKNRFRKRSNYKQLAGGKCTICNYNRCLDALQFHHTDPATKLFTITDAIWGKGGYTEEEILNEIKKCILICANCHAEHHCQNTYDL